MDAKAIEEAAKARQITDQADLAEKTIADINYDCWEPFILVFTDGTFAVFSVEYGYEGDSGVQLSDSLPDWGRLVDAGILSREERAILEADKRARYAAVDEAQERAQYERLRAKYG